MAVFRKESIGGTTRRIRQFSFVEPPRSNRLSPTASVLLPQSYRLSPTASVLLPQSYRLSPTASVHSIPVSREDSGPVRASALCHFNLHRQPLPAGSPQGVCVCVVMRTCLSGCAWVSMYVCELKICVGRLFGPMKAQLSNSLAGKLNRIPPLSEISSFFVIYAKCVRGAG